MEARMSAPTPAFDPVAFVAKAIADLNQNAAQAVEASKAAQTQDVLRAVAAMQSLMRDRLSVLREIAGMLNNPSINPDVQQAIRDVAAPGVAVFNGHLRQLESMTKVWQARANILRAALREATTTHSVYAAGTHSGVKLVQQTVHHAVTLSA
jgi:hypothetical protein